MSGLQSPVQSFGTRSGQGRRKGCSSAEKHLASTMSDTSPVSPKISVPSTSQAQCGLESTRPLCRQGTLLLILVYLSTGHVFLICLVNKSRTLAVAGVSKANFVPVGRSQKQKKKEKEKHSHTRTLYLLTTIKSHIFSHQQYKHS